MNFLRMHSITVIVGQNSCCKDGGEQHHLKTIFQPPGYVTPFGEFILCQFRAGYCVLKFRALIYKIGHCRCLHCACVPMVCNIYTRK